MPTWETRTRGAVMLPVNITIAPEGVERSWQRNISWRSRTRRSGWRSSSTKGSPSSIFWATWCGPCHMVTPILDQLAGEYVGKLKVTKVDVDANQKTAMRFNVRSIPSILFFKDGRHVDTLVGAYPKPIFEQKIQQHLS